MYKTRAEAEQFARELCDLLGGVPTRAETACGAGGTATSVDAAICVPFTALPGLAQAFAPCGVAIGAQNVHQNAEGAFTGEISAGMLQELGCSYAIVGHSERRQHFAETDASVAQKTVALLNAGIIPVVCVGETLEERDAGRTESVVRVQMEAVLAAVRELGADRSHAPAPKGGAGGEPAANAAKGKRQGAVQPVGPLPAAAIVVAYEPVWAIGTGRSSSAQDAQQVAGWIRAWLASGIGADATDAVRILYGGSVKPDNIASFVALPDIDGALVGGASLQAASFAQLLHNSREDM